MYEHDRSAEVEEAALRASAEFAAYVRELIEHRRDDPRDDLLSDLIAAAGDEGSG